MNSEVIKGKKALVVGGAGYIGSHIVKHLCEADCDVTVYDNISTGILSNIDGRAGFIEGDILNTDALTQTLSTGFDIVFHFAALKAAGDSMKFPGEYAHNNINGSLSLLRAMDKTGVKNLVFSSTAAVYGSPQYLPMDELHPKAPENFYGFSKLVIEQNIEWFGKLKGMNYAVLRYFNAAGYDVTGGSYTREKNAQNLAAVIMEVAAGLREKLLVFGNDYPTKDGTGIRDYIHTNDLTTAHILAFEHLLAGKESFIANLGTGSGFTVLEMIRAAEEATGVTIPYEIVERREGDPSEVVAVANLANSILGWKAEHSDLKTIFSSMVPFYFPYKNPEIEE